MPIPLHRGILPRCSPKFFTRSMGFAVSTAARLPFVPCGSILTMRQDSLHVTACKFASLTVIELFIGLQLARFRQRLPTSYGTAWSLSRSDLHRLVIPSLARRALNTYKVWPICAEDCRLKNPELPALDVQLHAASPLLQHPFEHLTNIRSSLYRRCPSAMDIRDHRALTLHRALPRPIA